MPELPEVETVRTALSRTIAGKTIARMELRRTGLRTPFAADMVQRLEGACILNISRRAKYLLFELSSGDALIAHLGMSGRFTCHASAMLEPGKHDHVIMHFSGGDCLTYNDPRRFGLMELAAPHELAAHRLLVGLGVEPLSAEFNVQYLKNTLKIRKSPIKTALMEQSLVVGVGNIYASEALFLAGIHPQIPAAEAVRKADRLVQSVQAVLKAAIASGGSSLRDFVDINGQTGYFQHAFKVYGRAKKPCMRCASPVVAIKQAGRSTFFCPKCQK